MNQKIPRTGLAMSIPAGLLTAAAAAIAMTGLGALVLAKLVELQKLPMEKIGYGIMTVLSAAAFFSSMLAVRKIKRRKVLICITSGFLYWGSLIAITALFFGGEFETVWQTCLLILIGSGAAAVISVQKGIVSGKIRGIKRRK